MRGSTIPDALALCVVGGVFASLLIVLGCTEEGTKRKDPMQFEVDKVECLNKLRNLAGMLEAAASRSDYPRLRGPNLVLYLAAKGFMRTEDHFSLLFCPGDEKESLAAAGGPAAYADIDLAKQGEYGRLTSYAGRDQIDEKCAVHSSRASSSQPGPARAYVLICDDSEDHHDGRGFCVGLTGGAVRWRDKVEHWDLDPATKVVVGPDSPVEELTCLRVD